MNSPFGPPSPGSSFVLATLCVNAYTSQVESASAVACKKVVLIPPLDVTSCWNEKIGSFFDMLEKRGLVNRPAIKGPAGAGLFNHYSQTTGKAIKRKGSTMWGWKAAERRIEPSVTLEQAKTIMKGAGFSEHIANPEHVIFRRAGTWLAVKGEKAAVEVALAKTEAGLLLQARYDTFVLFDTGDMQKLADDLVAKLKA